MSINVLKILPSYIILSLTTDEMYANSHSICQGSYNPNFDVKHLKIIILTVATGSYKERTLNLIGRYLSFCLMSRQKK